MIIAHGPHPQCHQSWLGVFVPLSADQRRELPSTLLFFRAATITTSSAWWRSRRGTATSGCSSCSPTCAALTRAARRRSARCCATRTRRRRRVRCRSTTGCSRRPPQQTAPLSGPSCHVFLWPLSIALPAWPAVASDGGGGLQPGAPREVSPGLLFVSRPPDSAKGTQRFG